MNMVDFQEKMDPTHRMYLCRMLNVKNLSEALLGRYAQVKMLVDRIDGHLTPCGLAMIIVSVGDEPEIAIKFLDDVDLQAEAKELTEKPSVGQTLDDSDDKAIEEAVEPTVEQLDKEAVEKTAAPVEVPSMTGAEAAAAVASGAKPVSGATGQATEEEGKAMLWFPGMPVRVLQNGELNTGKIVGVSNPSEVGKQVGAAVQLTVEFEGGDTVTAEEKEVEVI